ncbi:MAG: bifunctional aldolase/short-chain dehydrogenase [Rhodospirillales bacterium]|nr:bifunctional aldolase/short-chain dehydrogenase [Rhodospirillales bacterium]
MKNRWREADAAALVRRLRRRGTGEALALRVYTSRLLGSDPRLVLHGGGNTSVKVSRRGARTGAADVLHVKGSGWDMAAIEPEGLPGVELAPLRALRSRAALSDEAMVQAHRAHLLDPAAPSPSVETLLHAFLPHTYIDHTHANAVLAATNQPDGAARARAIWGDRVGIVPYVMPGFRLAKACAAVYEDAPEVEGLILLGHGIFTFGPTARIAYDRMIALVSAAERALAEPQRSARPVRSRPPTDRAVTAAAPVLRGLLCRALDPDRAGRPARRLVLVHRSSTRARWFADHPDLATGPVTPDHVLRTKPHPLVIPARGRAAGTPGFRCSASSAFAAYTDRYRSYLRANAGRSDGPVIPLDPAPRVLLAPGLGVFAAGPSRRAAAIAADLAETTAEVIRAADALGSFQALPDADLFDVEYWPLEQAKLGTRRPLPFEGHVVVVTGGAGAIGRATAQAFRAEGADVVLLDRDRRALEQAATDVGGLAIATDLTRPDSVAGAFDRIVRTFGGLDVLVSNAGVAYAGAIADVDEATLRESFEVNFFAHQRVAQAALAVFRAQGIGGCLLFNVSKQAVYPGPKLGAYSTAKAATLALMRQYALECGSEGIRANAVNPDRIRSGILDDAMIKARARERKLSVEDYMAGNLLGEEVQAADVAQAFVLLARQERTTAGVLTVDGGNLAAAVR